MKQKKQFIRMLSLVLTAVMLITTILTPLPAFAAEDDPSVDEDTLSQTEDVTDQSESEETIIAEVSQDNPVEETEEPYGEDGGDEEPDADLPPEPPEPADEPEVNFPTDEEEETSEIEEKPITDSPDNAEMGEEPGILIIPQEKTDNSEPPEAIPETGVIVVSEEEMSTMLEEAEKQETTDWETGMTVSGVLIWASEEERINLLNMVSGETVSFDMPTKRGATRGSSTEYVSITKGENFYYETYGLGSYVTSPYFIVFGNISAVAFCVQPALPGPGDGVYTIEQVRNNADLTKVIYYGTDASGSENFFDNYYSYFSTVVRFIITHIAASYANGSSDAFTGANETAQALAMELYYYAVNHPEIPDTVMSFSNSNVSAYKDGDIQRTENVTFYADSSQRIVMNLPSGVVFHNVTTGATSRPGASVTVAGGTTFYLSAPLSQTGDSGGNWSSTMHGSVSENYAAYKITTGWDEQDLAFIFGEGSNHEQTVSFSVSWLSLARIFITKTDEASGKNLAGAVFGVYSDPGCTNLIVKMPATDANGSSSVEISAAQDTVYLKEITPPKGYAFNASALDVRVVAGQDSSLTVSNKQIMGSLTIYKEGEVLTGATVTDDGVTFQYENRRLSGASYQVTAGADIFAADGTAIYRQGDMVAERLTTGSDGSVTLPNLHLGTYIVTEIEAPKDYLNEGVSKKITLTASDPAQEVVMDTVTFENERQKVAVVISKVDSTTKNPLSGSVYGLFAEDIISADGNVLVQNDTLIEKASTGADGTAAFSADLPLNASYYVKELQAPKKYVRNETDVFTFTAVYTGETEPEIKFSYTFENECVNARIDLVKVDLETGEKTQGDSTLEGATYGLYAKEDIIHPDGKTGVIYEKGTQIATLTTDKNGMAFIENLYLGKYTVKELVPSEGYLLDATEYTLECTDEGDQVPTVKRSVTSKEQVMKQPFQIIKAANNGKTEADLLRGVGFTVYLISSLEQNADGNYDFSSAEPAVITEDGQTEIFTDDRGYAQTVPLPYGKYLVRETTTPHNFSPVDDFMVTVSENNPTEPQVWRVLLDEEFSAKLKIVKKDEESKKPVLIANAEFKIYDMDNRKYVEQVTTYPETTVHKSYFTDANGYLILPNKLLPGHYRIEEVTAPDGYLLNTEGVEVIIDCDTAYEVDSISGDAIITVEMENHPVKGRLEISKKGETLKNYGKDFIYELQPLAGSEFAVYASEDIYTPDHQTDANGNRIVIYAKDTLVATVVTDENGQAAVENLPLGSYYVKETKAPAGFVLSNQVQAVTFTYQDQKTPVIERGVEFINDRQKVSISVEKQDAQNGNKVSGTVFGLYTKAMISVNGKTIMDANKLLQEATTDDQGLAVFHVDLPLGYQFYVKEIKAPAGFVSSDEVLDFAPVYQGQDIPVVTLTAVKKNEPTKVSVTKADITTGAELDGATLTVLDKKGHVVERWTSEQNKPHIIQYLTVGETYTLREEYAPYGYLKATDVTFTVQDTADVQKIEMKDDVPTALLIITKKGEFLDKITVGNTAKGYMEHIFEYVTGSLTEVTFEVYAAEDIRAADGVSANHYQKDQLVGTITTDSKGVATMANLPVGKYYVKEVSTAHGYVLDQELRYIDLSYRDQNTSVVSFDENWQNNRQRVTVHVQKVEKGGNTPLAGGVFGLFTAEDIQSASGKTLVKKDTIIELKSTDAEGKIVFIADLPVDGRYYVQEQYAPDGYVTDREKKEFSFDYSSADQTEIVYEFLFENEATTVELSKQDVTTEKELPGAHLELRDDTGTLIEEWVSEDKPHVIRKLIVDKEYTLSETKPADGYVTAERVTFKIKDSAEVQKVVMKDNVTKVEISKTDITTGKELPGAKLTILDKDGKVVATWISTDKPCYIQKLPIGDYTLCEESAPDGYLKAENVKFTVKDTGEIQKVEMKDSPIKAPENPDTPKTGDLYKPLVWIGIGVAGVGLLVTSIILGKKRKYR